MLSDRCADRPMEAVSQTESKGVNQKRNRFITSPMRVRNVAVRFMFVRVVPVPIDRHQSRSSRGFGLTAHVTANGAARLAGCSCRNGMTYWP